MGKYFWNQGRWKWWNTCKFVFLSDPIIPLLLSNRKPTGSLLDGLFSECVGNPKQLSIENAVLCLSWSSLHEHLTRLTAFWIWPEPRSLCVWLRENSSFLLNSDQIMVSLDILSARPAGQKKRCLPRTRKQGVGHKRNGTPAHGKPSAGLDVGRVPMGNHDHLQSKCF